MRIKFDNLNKGRNEAINYQNAISIANSILVDLGLMSKIFLTWGVQVEYNPAKDNSVVEISIYENDDTPFYFLIKADIDMGTLVVDIKPVYHDYTDWCFPDKITLVGNFFPISDCSFVAYLEDLYVTCMEHMKIHLRNKSK